MEKNIISNDYLKFQYENLSEQHRAIHDANFNLYIKYEHDQEQELFVVDVDYVYPHIGFTRKDVCIRLLHKSYTVDKDFIILNTDTKDKYIEGIHYKNLLHLHVEQDQVAKTHGGHNKDKYYLTIKTFKDIFMNSSTKNAKIFRSYYQELERINHMYRKIEQDKLAYNETCIAHIRINHDMLLDRVICKRLVYIVYLHKITQNLQQRNEIPNNKQIIKIGMTHVGMRQRLYELQSRFSETIVLNIFEVNLPDEFEKFLHKHPFISNLLYPIERSKETFLVSISEYKKIVEISNENWNKYDRSVQEFSDKKYDDEQNNFSKKLSKIEKYMKNFMVYNTQTDVNDETLSIVTNLNSDITDYRTDPSSCDDPDKKEHVYILYNNDLNQLLVGYNPLTFCLQCLQNHKLNITFDHDKLMRLSTNNILYKNFRVLVMKRCDYIPNKYYSIYPHRSEYKNNDHLVIFKLNPSASKIIGEYSCLKEAADSECISKSAVDNFLHGKSSHAGSHLWNKLDNLIMTEMGRLLILEWRVDHDVVDGHNGRIIRSIYKLDPNTLDIIKRYNSLSEITLQENFKYDSLQIHNSWNKKQIIDQFIWCFHDKYVKPIKPEPKVENINTISDIQETDKANNIYSWLLFGIKNEFIKSFNSQMDILRYMYLVKNIRISQTALKTISDKNQIIDDKYRIVKKQKTDLNIPTTLSEASAKPYYSEKYKFIVKKNPQNTEILGIYNGWVDACESEEIKFTESAISSAITKNTKLNNKIWSYFGKTDQNLIDQYLKNNDLPKLFKMDKRGEVLVINFESKTIYKKYVAIEEAVLCENIKDKTIIKRDQDNKPYRGYFWKLKRSDQSEQDVVDTLIKNI